MHIEGFHFAWMEPITGDILTANSLAPHLRQKKCVYIDTIALDDA